MHDGSVTAAPRRRAALLGAGVVIIFLCTVVACLHRSRRPPQRPPTARHEIVLTAGGTRYEIAYDGTLLSAKTQAGELLANRGPLFAVKKAGHWFRVTSLAQRGDGYHATFGGSGVMADFRLDPVPGALMITLSKVQGSDVQQLDLALLVARPVGTPGHWLAVLSNPRETIALLATTDSVRARLVPHGSNMEFEGSAFPQFGMDGQGVAIVTAPTTAFLRVIHRLENRFRLPAPTIAGQWAKTSPDARSSYLLTDLTEGNVDETIRYARRGNFKYILIYAWTWASSLGSYPVNVANYPNGEEGLAATIAKVHAAGLKVGMHMLTSFVSKNDPLVRPIPDPRLLKDAQARLAAPVDSTATTIVASAPLRGFPGSPAFYGSNKAGTDIQIGNEILECSGVGVGDPRVFSRCKRGFAGTRASPHPGGSRVEHLAERYGSYLVNLRTSLKQQLANRISALIDRCGFDMVYFDGGEANSADGPAWYWVSQQQMAIWKRVHRSLLMLGSGLTQWDWHLFGRMSSDDAVELQPKAYLDSFKIPGRWNMYKNNFMSADLGWWGLFDSTPERAATLPDEAELYGVRMLALNAPLSLETTLSQLEANGRTDEMLGMIGRYDRLRLANAVPKSVRAKLRSGEWHMSVSGNQVNFIPVHEKSARIGVPGQLRIRGRGGAQPLRFRIRALATPGRSIDRGALVLLHPASPMSVPLPAAGSRMPGALAARFPLGGMAGSLNLKSHQAIVVALDVRGPADRSGALPGVLNVQLECPGQRYRDYHVDLGFRGTRAVTIASPGTLRTLTEFRPSAYNFKAAMNSFSYDRVVALNLRWMRSPSVKLDVHIRSVTALPEAPNPLQALTLADGASRITLPVTLEPGDYAEYWGDGPLKVFDAHGRLLASAAVPHPIVLEPGANSISVEASAAGTARLTSFAFGAPMRVSLTPSTASQILSAPAP
jgi:hypothetical protein